MADMTDGSILISSESTEPVTSEVNGFLCDPCGEDGNNIPANGYCEDCDEYLCWTCYNGHCKPRPSRHHVLQDASHMPMQKKKYMSRSSTIKCPLHPDIEVSFYSKSQDKVYCQNCVSVLTGHGMCNDFVHLDEVAMDIQNNEEFKAFDRKLHTVHSDYTQNKVKATMHLQLIDKQYDQAKTTFIERLDEIKAKDVSKMTNVIGKCDTAMKQLDKWISDKEKFQEDNSQLFVLMKLNKKQLDVTGESVEPLARDNAVLTYAYRNLKVSEDKILGKLVTLACHIKEINVKHSSETKVSSLHDILLLEGDLMLVSDCSNNSIKLINISNNTILSYTNLKTEPREMTITENGQVYVTQPWVKKLLHLTSPTVNVSKTSEIPVTGQCWAVKYHEQKLKMQNLPDFVETDLNGKVIRTVLKDCTTAKTDQGKRIMTYPIHSFLNKKTGSMILSCWKENSITEVRSDGKVNLIVKSDKLQEANGLVMDTDGSMLVGSGLGKCVFRVTCNGDIEDILPEQLEFKVYALALDKTGRKLYVGGENDHVLVYQI